MWKCILLFARHQIYGNIKTRMGCIWDFRLHYNCHWISCNDHWDVVCCLCVVPSGSFLGNHQTSQDLDWYTLYRVVTGPSPQKYIYIYIDRITSQLIFLFTQTQKKIYSLKSNLFYPHHFFKDFFLHRIAKPKCLTQVFNANVLNPKKIKIDLSS